MSNRRENPDRAPWIVVFGAVFLMAHFISGKAARDSLFLLNFPIETLPRMTIFAAATSLLMVLFWSRRLATKSPAAMVPWALLGASLLQFVLWAIYFVYPRVSSVLFYLYMIGPNAILLSSYWSLLNERFDPREAKRLFGRVAAGGTFGGLASGVVADQFAGIFGPSVLLPFQGVLQFCAFLLIRNLSLSMTARQPQTPAAAPDIAAGLRILRKNRYLFTLASLVFFVTMSANLLDYVFKAGVTGMVGRGENLVSFFALYYAFSGLVTFLMQTFAAQWIFERLGLTQSLFALPVSYFLGILGYFSIPGLGGMVGLRGAEAVTRGSIYRSGYEICYTPVRNQEKRATKTIIDVGADRLGEATGAFLVQSLLLAGLTGGPTGLLAIGCVLSAGAGLITFRLGRLYVGALETSLLSRAREVEERDALPNWSADSIVMGSMATIPLRSLASHGLAERAPAPHVPTEELAPPPKLAEPAAPVARLLGSVEDAEDPVLQRIADLRSRDYARVREALLHRAPIGSELVPFLIRLLAWDEVAELVIRLLRKATCPREGQLADALLNPNEDFSIRRRIPRILGNCPIQLSVEALIEALRDQRFEVRYRCGKALYAITSKNPGLTIDKNRILRAVEREFFVSKNVWNSYRLLERVEDAEEDPGFGEVLKDRTGKGLEHVFTLLSIVLPREPLQIAFRGLHTNDPQLRGTALEYLESVLPGNIRARLWPFLDADASGTWQKAAPRSRQEILEDLRRSNQSIIVNLEKFAQKRERRGLEPS